MCCLMHAKRSGCAVGRMQVIQLQRTLAHSCLLCTSSLQMQLLPLGRCFTLKLVSSQRLPGCSQDMQRLDFGGRVTFKTLLQLGFILIRRLRAKVRDLADAHPELLKRLTILVSSPSARLHTRA